jgi:hypothetical protein
MGLNLGPFFILEVLEWAIPTTHSASRDEIGGRMCPIRVFPDLKVFR